ncbi:MAG: hypothetical protein KBS64_06645 [Treponema sp.]|nr:hypothetical protein [Candidatus Treponema equi]
MKKLLAFFVASAVSMSLFAQSAGKISEIIATKKATYGQAAYLTAVAMGDIKDNASYEDALSVLKNKGVVAKDIDAGDVLDMKQLSWICASAWNVEGSLMLKLCNSPRYTFRQMKADEVIDYSADPSDIPSGRNLLAVVTDCIARYQLKSGGAM